MCVEGILKNRHKQKVNQTSLGMKGISHCSSQSPQKEKKHSTPSIITLLAFSMFRTKTLELAHVVNRTEPLLMSVIFVTDRSKYLPQQFAAFESQSHSLVGQSIEVQYLVLIMLRHLFIHQYIHIYAFSCSIKWSGCLTSETAIMDG